jgi:hypothetical protein
VQLGEELTALALRYLDEADARKGRLRRHRRSRSARSRNSNNRSSLKATTRNRSRATFEAGRGGYAP